MLAVIIIATAAIIRLFAIYVLSRFSVANLLRDGMAGNPKKLVNLRTILIINGDKSIVITIGFDTFAREVIKVKEKAV